MKGGGSQREGQLALESELCSSHAWCTCYVPGLGQTDLLECLLKYKMKESVHTTNTVCQVGLEPGGGA